jgi:hypothetical protein
MSRPFHLSDAISERNETTVLSELLRRLRDVLDHLTCGPHQIVFVDDRCIQATVDMVADAARCETNVLALSLSRTFVHQAAITAALDHVTEDASVVVDGDRQVSAAIHQFAEKFHNGFGLVATKSVRRNEPLMLRLRYFLLYQMMTNVFLGFALRSKLVNKALRLHSRCEMIRSGSLGRR